MDIVLKENLKVPNCVLISGLSNTTADDEVFEFLNKYGSISRIVAITDAQSSYCGTTVIEFEHGSSMEALGSLPLPHHRSCHGDPEIIHHIQSLAGVYTETCGTNTTKAYLSELKELAKLSGKHFEDILREELSRISDTVTDQPVVGDSDLPLDPGRPSLLCESAEMPHDGLQADSCRPLEGSGYHTPKQTEVSESGPTLKINSTPVILSTSQLTTPEVQRVVVEHVVRSAELASQLHAPLKLKPFSGRLPHQHFEVDYDTWRGTVSFYLNDPMISDAQVVRKIIESLSPPASNLIKSLGPLAPSKAYLDLLDSAFAAVGDGDELFAAFLNLNQNAGEKPSDYLHRLHTALSFVVRSKGLAATESDRQLLRQFCRGCWNNSLISNLQLEHRKQNPPNFSEFLFLLRTEEDRQTAKCNRMRQHLGATRAKTQPNVQAVCNPCLTDFDLPVDSDYIPSVAVQPLQKQIAKLQTQVAKLLTLREEKGARTKVAKRDKSKPADNKLDTHLLSDLSVSTPKPKPWYCFRCGEDGHIASSCSNAPNPSLVQAKRKELREKQHAWDIQNGNPRRQDLN